MRIQSPSDIASLIRVHRKAAGLTQAGLAHKIGMTRRWVSDIENGKSTSQIGRVLRVLNLLGVPMIAALPGEADKLTQTWQAIRRGATIVDDHLPADDFQYPDLDEEDEEDDLGEPGHD